MRNSAFGFHLLIWKTYICSDECNNIDHLKKWNLDLIKYLAKKAIEHFFTFIFVVEKQYVFWL